MARTKASQRPYFPLLGEPLALDLVNTVVLRDGVTVDLISQPHRWGQWLDYQRPRLEPALSGALTERFRSWAALERVRAFRGAVHVVIETARLGQPSGPQPDADLAHAALSEAAAYTAGSAVSITTSTTQLGAHLPVTEADTDTDTDTEALLGAFAVATIELVTSAGAESIRECQVPDCGLLFLPRHPTRRWCSAWTCGNRIRASRHYQQRRLPQRPSLP
jgi:predicted RNA-binding Zn ribbon-like protein